MLDSLIDKLVKAKEGTRELDAEIHCYVHPIRTTTPKLQKGYTIINTGDTIKNSNLAKSPYLSTRRGPSPHYTTSIDSALRLLPESDGEDGKRTFDWLLAKTNGGQTIHACVGSMEKYFAETPALAMCIAALKSREENNVMS